MHNYEFPECFYYYEKGSQGSFTEEPTGTISIERYLNFQRKCWQTPASENLKQKKILLSPGDFFEKNNVKTYILEQKKSQLKFALFQLYKQGFKIASVNKSLEEYTLGNINNLYALWTNDGYYSNNIEESDRVLIYPLELLLDIYAKWNVAKESMECFEKEFQTALHTQCLSSFCDDGKTLKSIKDLTIRITEKTSQDCLNQLNTYLPNNIRTMIVQNHYFSYDSKVENYKIFSATLPNEIDYLYFMVGLNLADNVLKSTKVICLGMSMCSFSKQFLLNSQECFRGLKFLEVGDLTLTDESQSDIVISLDSLETLVFNSEISRISFNAPNLRKIDYVAGSRNNLTTTIESCAQNLEKLHGNNLDFLAALKVKQLPKLISLKINSCTEKQIQQLQKLAPNLTDINITSPISSRVEAKYETNIHSQPLSQKTYKFKGLNDSLEQKVIIDKFCKYIELAYENSGPQLSRFQNGICASLSKFFIETGFTETRKFLFAAMEWDGVTPIDTALLENFEKLYILVSNDYIAKKSDAYGVGLFTGDNLADFLANEDNLLITNPWHTIAIKKENDELYIYDPNDSFGPVVIKSTELAAKVVHKLGHVLTIKSNKDFSEKPTPTVANIFNFIEQGGLLSYHSLPPQIKQEINHTLVNEANANNPQLLKGLLIYDTENKQGWRYLPAKLHKQIRDNFNLTIDNSSSNPLPKLPELKPLLKPGFTKAEPKEPQQEITRCSYTVMVENYFDRLTNSRISDKKPLDCFLLSLFDSKKLLLRTADKSQLQAIRNGLQILGKKTSKNVFYIHTSNDLKLVGKTLKPQQDGSVKIEDGSILQDFLNKHDNVTLLINYDNFAFEDIIAFNELLDEPQTINALPVNVKVIGLQSTSKTYYNGSDFTSRFAQTICSPYTIEDLAKYVDIGCFSNAQETKPQPEYIDIIDPEKWQEVLFGKFLISPEGLSFLKGALTDLIIPSVLYIQNAPHNDEDYIEFWRNAKVTGKIFIYGMEFEVPSDLTIMHSENSTLNCDIFVTEEGSPQHVLNKYNMSHFTGGYLVGEKGNLEYTDGIIAAYETPINVLLTERLTPRQWYILSKKCSANQKLNVRALCDNLEPEGYNDKFLTLRCTLKCIKSNIMIIENNECKVIDISNCDGFELFDYVERLPGADGYFGFRREESLLIQLLKTEKVILKGHFSDKLLQYIAAKIILDPALCDNLTLIGDMDSNLEIFGECDYKTYEIPVVQESSNIEPDNSQNYHDFQLRRKKLITDVLSTQPCVLVTGLSGCGKSTFIQEEFQPFMGIENLQNWIDSKGEEDRYLFIDEANLLGKDFLEFANLYNNPPTIIFKGKLIDLSIHHKVIFAGNPESYGDERVKPKLFTYYTKEVIFDTIPSQVVKEKRFFSKICGCLVAPQVFQVGDRVLSASIPAF